MVIVIAGCGGVGAKMAEEKHQNALHQISQSREQYFACNFHFKFISIQNPEQYLACNFSAS